MILISHWGVCAQTSDQLLSVQMCYTHVYMYHIHHNPHTYVSHQRPHCIVNYREHTHIQANTHIGSVFSIPLKLALNSIHLKLKRECTSHSEFIWVLNKLNSRHEWSKAQGKCIQFMRWNLEFKISKSEFLCIDSRWTAKLFLRISTVYAIEIVIFKWCEHSEKADCNTCM